MDQNEKELKRLNALIKDIADFGQNGLNSPLGHKIASTLSNAIEDNLHNQSDSFGNKFAFRAAGEDPARKVLYQSGALFNNWQPQVREDYAGVSNNSAPYGAFHQFGTKSKTGGQKLPARPFLPIKGSNQDNAVLDEKITASLAQELEESIAEILKKHAKG